ncbi:ABC transporter ATP-binding protein/permease [Nocardia aurantia]|uniref:Vitamin B12 import ATP-binding protein BtuD n=1 Tax=Nocardia aurantia TaxID=2585199 RepID=A0A7K0DGB3_9NOCA|nr:ATP-binding cassette domain-containing protein [Nocardia aurantia]MQY24687.1 Vitamin B12 import ATP-binding protein BtuD [Nocardia aurantia]
MAAPVDPRLWRYARSARRYLVAAVALSLVTTAGIVVAAVALAEVLAGVITDPSRRDIASWNAALTVLAGAVLCRTVATWWQARLAHRAGARVVAELETAVLAAAAELPPRELDSRRTESAVVVADGLSGLRPYFSGYLPALLLAVLVPPSVLTVILLHDPVSGAVIAITLPLIPIFMILIGRMTQGRSAATLAAATRLSGQLLDLFAGLPTLRALGRETVCAAEGPAPAARRARRHIDREVAGTAAADRTCEHEVIGAAADSALAPRRADFGGVGASAATTAVPGRDGGNAGCAAVDAVSDRAVVPGPGSGAEGETVRPAAGRGAVPRDSGGGTGRETVDVTMVLASEQQGSDGADIGVPAVSARTMRHRVYELGAALRERTMAALRVAFLSSMVLELLATLCVALVAVSIGMRLVYGHMSLYAGLLALILAPEVYLPLRAVGERFHAAQDGMAAADKAFGLLENPARMVPGDRRFEEPHPIIDIRDLSVAARDGLAPAALSAVLRPGTVTVFTGPNGCGKSTALQAILGLTTPSGGRVLVAGTPVAELDPEHWWQHLAWLPQRPVLLPGTLRENLDLLGTRAFTAIPESELHIACAATGFDDVLRELPDGWDTVVGAGGTGLSLGQRQRLALTRILLAERPILLLDEPTAHLDDVAEARVLAALVARARAGATVVLVGHRPAVLAAADEVITVFSTATARSPWRQSADVIG